MHLKKKYLKQDSKGLKTAQQHSSNFFYSK